MISGKLNIIVTRLDSKFMLFYTLRNTEIYLLRQSSVFLKLMCDRLAAVTDDDATSEESEHASVISDDDGDF